MHNKYNLHGFPLYIIVIILYSFKTAPMWTGQSYVQEGSILNIYP